RYETANDFAADVQRYLADVPVLAGPLSAWYRFRKFVLRNRVLLTLASAVGLLLAGAGAFAWHTDQQAAQRWADEQARLGRNAEAVAILLDQCEADLRLNRADRAAISLAAAERRLADGGAGDLTSRHARCRTDFELLSALDAIDTFRWTPTDGRFP